MNLILKIVIVFRDFDLAIFDPACEFLEVMRHCVAMIDQEYARVVILVTQAPANDLVDFSHCHRLIPLTSVVFALQHHSGVCHKLIGYADDKDCSRELISKVESFTHLSTRGAHEYGFAIFCNCLLVLCLYCVCVV